MSSPSQAPSEKPSKVTMSVKPSNTATSVKPSRTIMSVKPSKVTVSVKPSVREIPLDKAPKAVRYSLELNKPPPIRTEKKRKVKSYPQHAPPKSVVIPGQPVPEGHVRYLSVKTDGQEMNAAKQRHAKPIVPGWLIDLKDEQLEAIATIRSALESGDTPSAIINAVAEAIGNLGISVNREEMTQILRRVPYSADKKWSFSHFMYGMANPEAAAAKKIFLPAPRDIQVDQEGGDTKKPSEDKAKEKETTEQEEPTAASGYSDREKLFYSGLLIQEMYETLNKVENLYYQDEIPESPGAIAARNRRRGFGEENIGTKKFGWAEWDRPPKPLPKISPYLTSSAFVSNRWKILKPNIKEQGRRRTLNQLVPLHMLIVPPQQPSETIRVVENRVRIKKALNYLASQGDCVALLPDVHFIMHMSDTFVEKLEERRTNPVKAPIPQKIYHDAELAWLNKEANRLYYQFKLPEAINKLTTQMSYADGLHLRAICKKLRDEHWAMIDRNKVVFRSEAWNVMHVDRMPPGRLRDSFIHAFMAYLPFKSHLPMGLDAGKGHF